MEKIEILARLLYESDLNQILSKNDHFEYNSLDYFVHTEEEFENRIDNIVEESSLEMLKEVNHLLRRNALDSFTMVDIDKKYLKECILDDFTNYTCNDFEYFEGFIIEFEVI